MTTLSNQVPCPNCNKPGAWRDGMFCGECEATYRNSLDTRREAETARLQAICDRRNKEECDPEHPCYSVEFDGLGFPYIKFNVY